MVDVLRIRAIAVDRLESCEAYLEALGGSRVREGSPSWEEYQVTVSRAEVWRVLIDLMDAYGAGE